MTSASIPVTDDDAAYEIWHERGCAIVVTSGDIDLHSARHLHEALEAAAVISDRLIVDLTNVHFVDSYGVGILVGAPRRTQHPPVSLVRPPPVLRRLLDLTGLGEVMPAYMSREEALTAVAR